MAPIYTPVSAIVAGKIKLKLKVRVVHLWTVPDFNMPNEECFLHMLLLDERNGKIQASAKKALIPSVKTRVTEGATYELENVLVTHNDPKYQTTRHRYKLLILPNTSWTKLDEDVIPLNQFDFVDFKDILSSANEGQYVDVIGHVVEVDEMKDKSVNGRTSKLIDLTLEDAEGNRVHCSLWGEYAMKISEFLALKDQESPPVVVIQLGKIKRYFGAMGVCNAFHGTKLLLDNELPDVVEYRKRIHGAEIQVTQGVGQASGSLSVPLPDDLIQSRMMTIEDLIEANEKCYGVVLATICGIESEHGWYYEACTKCAGKVRIVAGRMWCGRCKKSRNALPRYKVHVQVIDLTGSTSFIIFDRNVQNYVGQNVQDLIDRFNQVNSKREYPQELDVFIGKEMLFKVEVGDGNLLHGWRNYSVKRTSDDKDLLERFKTLNNVQSITYDDASDDPPPEPLQILSHSAPLEKLLLESGDSTNSQPNLTEDTSTPCSKLSGKRSAEDMDVSIIAVEKGNMSTTQTKKKATKIKTEKLD